MMKKVYIQPETCVIVMPAIQPLLVGSLTDTITGLEGGFDDDPNLNLDGD